MPIFTVLAENVFYLNTVHQAFWSGHAALFGKKLLFQLGSGFIPSIAVPFFKLFRDSI